MGNEIEEDFISLYLKYTEETECPKLFNRWTILTSLAAMLGRDIHFKHGHFTIYPNLYVMLIGLAGTKKSSAIKIGAKLIGTAGYDAFAAKKTRQEKYLLDLAEAAEAKYNSTANPEDIGYDAILDMNLFGNSQQNEASRYEGRPPAESFIAADEFNNFLGVNNLDFAAILGELWDYEGVYDYRLKNSKSIYIPYPTVNLLGGNTQTNLSLCFPTEAIGQGFFSRLILVYGEPSGKLYTFPPPPDLRLQGLLVEKLKRIKANVKGESKLSPDAEKLLDHIYKNWEGIDDPRFDSYRNRRLTHLIKLCMVVAAARESIVISYEDVIKANTYLSCVEKNMPKALGEFGKAKHSAVTHKVISLIESSMVPVTFQMIWKLVHQDLDNRQQLVEIISSLELAQKIQATEVGLIPFKKQSEVDLTGTVDLSLITNEERRLL